MHTVRAAAAAGKAPAGCTWAVSAWPQCAWAPKKQVAHGAPAHARRQVAAAHCRSVWRQRADTRTLLSCPTCSLHQTQEFRLLPPRLASLQSSRSTSGAAGTGHAPMAAPSASHSTKSRRRSHMTLATTGANRALSLRRDMDFLWTLTERTWPGDCEAPSIISAADADNSNTIRGRDSPASLLRCVWLVSPHWARLSSLSFSQLRAQFFSVVPERHVEVFARLMGSCGFTELVSSSPSGQSAPVDGLPPPRAPPTRALP